MGITFLEKSPPTRFQINTTLHIAQTVTLPPVPVAPKAALQIGKALGAQWNRLFWDEHPTPRPHLTARFDAEASSAGAAAAHMLAGVLQSVNLGSPEQTPAGQADESPLTSRREQKNALIRNSVVLTPVLFGSAFFLDFYPAQEFPFFTIGSAVFSGLALSSELRSLRTPVPAQATLTLHCNKLPLAAIVRSPSNPENPFSSLRTTGVVFDDHPAAANLRTAWSSNPKRAMALPLLGSASNVLTNDLATTARALQSIVATERTA